MSIVNTNVLESNRQIKINFDGGDLSSDNTAGNSEATTVEKAMEYFGDGVAMYIDSQEERGKKGTTQLDLRTGEIKVMRESDTLPMRKIREILREKGIEVYGKMGYIPYSNNFIYDSMKKKKMYTCSGNIELQQLLLV